MDRAAYGENITFDLASQAGKSTNIDLGVGYNLNQSMGVGLGAIILSNNLDASLNAAVPHPYVFNAPRTATGAYASDVKATILYLNFIYRVSVSKFTVNLFAGPAYFNSSADIINTVAIEDVFPNTSVAMTLSTENVKKSSFGFNAGAGLNYFFAKSLGVFLEARYLSGKRRLRPQLRHCPRDHAPHWRIERRRGPAFPLLGRPPRKSSMKIGVCGIACEKCPRMLAATCPNYPQGCRPEGKQVLPDRLMRPGKRGTPVF